MDVKDYLPILFERTNTSVSLWNFEAVVVLGIIGFLTAAGRNANHWWIKLMMTIGWIGFVFPNLGELIRVSHQRETLANAVKPLLSGPLSNLSEYIFPTSLYIVIGLHVLFDIGTLVVIWVLPRVYPVK